MKVVSNLFFFMILLKKLNLFDVVVVVSDVVMVIEKIIYGMNEINLDEKMLYFIMIIVKKRRE